MQVWRGGKAAGIRRAEAWYQEQGTNCHSFVAEHQLVSQGVEPVEGDFVYLAEHWAIGIVAGVDTSTASTTFNVQLAAEHNSGATQVSVAMYRFSSEPRIAQATRPNLTFPIDVSFDRVNGWFTLHKSASMPTV